MDQQATMIIQYILEFVNRNPIMLTILRVARLDTKVRYVVTALATFRGVCGHRARSG